LNTRIVYYLLTVLLITFISCNKGSNPADQPSFGVPAGNNVIYALGNGYYGGPADTYGIYTNNSDTGGTQTPLIESKKTAFYCPNWTNEDKVCFLSNYQGETKKQIYSINFDGTAVRRISNDTLSEYSTLDVSLVNGRLLYTRNTGGGKQLCSNNIQMNDEKVLLSGAVSASWSPDGRSIVYSNSELNNNGEKIMNLFLMNADGTGIIKITSNILPQLTYSTPFISPGGNKILYTSYRERLVTNTTLLSSLTDVYTCNINGSNEQRITNSYPQTESWYNANWSKDGKKMLLIYLYIRMPYSLVVRNTDNNSQIQATYSWGMMDADIK